MRVQQGALVFVGISEAAQKLSCRNVKAL